MPAKKKAHPQDFTGRKTEKLQKERAADVERREGEISMARAAEAREMNEVIDYSAGAHTPGTRQPGMPGTEMTEEGLLITYADEGGEDFVVQTNDTAVVGEGSESPFDVVGGTAHDEKVRAPHDPNSPARLLPYNDDSVISLGGSVEIRVNADINPTIGAGNEYEFKEGRRYRVPRHVADHLYEKGYA